MPIVMKPRCLKIILRVSNNIKTCVLTCVGARKVFEFLIQVYPHNCRNYKEIGRKLIIAQSVHGLYIST